MIYTNINIKDTYNSFIYMIEYGSSDTIKYSDDLRYYLSYIPLTNQNCVNFLDDYTNLIRNGNTWKPETSDGSIEWLPKYCMCEPINDSDIKNIWLDKNIDIEDKECDCGCEPIKGIKDIWVNTNDDKFDPIYDPSASDHCAPIYMGIVKDIWDGKSYSDNEDQSNIRNRIRYKTSKIRLYFPQFSVDTYERGVKYALTINTWIHGYRVSIGTYIINRLDALASYNNIRKYGNNYYEYVEFDIIDPWDLTFGDDWDDFRKNICKEKTSTNSIGSILNFSLYPVYEYDGEYIMIDGYQGGQNSINITLNTNDYLNLNIKPILENQNPDNINWKPSIKCEVNFNNSYIGDIKEYLKETYNIDSYDVIISYELALKNKDDIYMLFGGDSSKNIYEFTERWENNGEPLSWKWWDEYHKKYKDNLYLQAIANIRVKYCMKYCMCEPINDSDIKNIWLDKNIDIEDKECDCGCEPINDSDIKNIWLDKNIDIEDKECDCGCEPIKGIKDIWDGKSYSDNEEDNEEDDYEYVLHIKSNELPLTQELFSYFVNIDEFNCIDLNNLDMVVINMNCVNKTENKIYQFDKPEDSKSNIIQPVFFKARDAANIIVHPAVTENICINLDSFKSKVKTFMIQIEGCPFTEIGRTASGVIFKIIGTKLPNNISEGVYYILNEDGELVTNGKYTYDY